MYTYMYVYKYKVSSYIYIYISAFIQHIKYHILLCVPTPKKENLQKNVFYVTKENLISAPSSLTFPFSELMLLWGKGFSQGRPVAAYLVFSLYLIQYLVFSIQYFVFTYYLLIQPRKASSSIVNSYLLLYFFLHFVCI